MKTLFSTIIVSMFFFVNAFAQSSSSSHNVAVSVPQVALVNVLAPSTGITLSLTVPATAGDWFAPVTNSLAFLQVSSVKPSDGSRNINVKATGIPSGLVLKVEAAGSSTGKGGRGTVVAGGVVLDGTDAPIVEGITTGFTGSSANNGFQLTYTLAADETEDNVDDLVSGASNVTVTYTITE